MYNSNLGGGKKSENVYCHILYFHMNMIRTYVPHISLASSRLISLQRVGKYQTSDVGKSRSLLHYLEVLLTLMNHMTYVAVS